MLSLIESHLNQPRGPLISLFNCIRVPQYSNTVKKFRSLVVVDCQFLQFCSLHSGNVGGLGDIVQTNLEIWRFKSSEQKLSVE